MKYSKGFTLIEILIVVAIIGIIAAVAIPSYNNVMQNTRRADAQSALHQFAQAMERFRAVRYTYQGAAAVGANSGFPDPTVFGNTHSPFDSGTKFYELRVDAPAPNEFTVTATPIDAQATDRCGVLSINQAGVKGVTLSTVADCWRN